MEPHKHAEVIKAWADGAEIECRCPVNNTGWLLTNVPAWYEDYEYRVKPQPKKYKVDVWLVLDSEGETLFTYLAPPPEPIYEEYHVMLHTLEGELPNV